MAPSSPPGSLAPGLDILAEGARPSDWAEERPAGAEIWRNADGGVFALCRAEGDRYWMDLPGLATLRFDHRGDRVEAAPRPGVAASRVSRAYWDAALPLVLHARGSEVLHAGAVLGPRGVIAFCGGSGSGKSTIAYGLYRRGYALWADDAVALDIAPSSATAVALPFASRLRPATAALFGLGAGALRLPRPADAETGSGRERMPLAAIYLLDRRPGAGGVTLSALRPALAYPRVLAHAFCWSFEDLARKRLMLERYLALAARVPVFDLGVPDGLEHVPAALDAVERAVGSADTDAR